MLPRRTTAAHRDAAYDAEMSASQARVRKPGSHEDDAVGTGADQRHSSQAAQVDESEGHSEACSTDENGLAVEQDRSIAHLSVRSEESHLKILLATDCHVGYMEKDPVRGQDAINTFREILKIAVERDVDMILLGGDLFHENKPSRPTLHQVMASLRQYCLSDKPVSIELLSDPNDGKAEGYDFPAINYEDPNLNVGIPVFSIHGNHDDPQGVGIEGALSALDVLSVSGLVNYFGKVELPSNDATAQRASRTAPDAGGLSDVGIRIRPVLLRKGNTKLALYGMGNVKDERMHYELRSNRVRMYRPRESPNDWFNILVVHQNRAAHNPKACVPETMFDDSVHLVVWGHEHEQMISPQSVGGKSYCISQPGSSVATSLSPGETKEKCVGIIHIEGTNYSIEAVPLHTVRPFVMDDMSLAEEADDAGVDLTDKAAVQKLLRNRVYKLIDKANENSGQKYADIAEKNRAQPMLPLVRLRVEYDASFELGNPIRFGQEFVDKVANPKDVLQFTKRRATAARKQKSGDDERYAYVDVDVENLMPAEKFERIKIGGLVKEFLHKQNLELLNPDGLERAVTNFVEKDDRDAIQHFIKGMTKTLQGQLNSMQPDEGALARELDRIRDESYRNRRYDSDHEVGGARPGAGPLRSRQRTGPTGGRRAGQVNSDDSMLDDMEPEGDDFFDDNDEDGSAAVRPSESNASERPDAVSRSKASATATTSLLRLHRDATFLKGNDDEDDDVRSSKMPKSSSRTSVLAMGSIKKKTPARSSKATPAVSTMAPKARGGRAAVSKAGQGMSAAARWVSEGESEGDNFDGFVIDEDAS